MLLFCYNRYSNMTSFKRFGSKSVVKYAYIGISGDRQCHNLLWQLYKNKYRICPIRIEKDVILEYLLYELTYWYCVLKVIISTNINKGNNYLSPKINEQHKKESRKNRNNSWGLEYILILPLSLRVKYLA
jgi:hypothetical protein